MNIISNHNKTVLNGGGAIQQPLVNQCNCKKSASCPMEGNCRQSSIVYKASINMNGKTMHYYGLCSTDFKARFYNHKQSFNDPRKRNNTELSKVVWQLKDNGTAPCIQWSVADRAPPYQCGSRHCNLCLAEKLAILQADQKSLLNKRSELVAKCRHSNKFKLANQK